MTGGTRTARNGRRTLWRAISARVREKELRRQRLYNRGRKAVLSTYLETGVQQALPALLREYLEKLLGAAIAFWLIGALLSRLHVRSLYALATFGVLYCLQSAYYRYRLAADPEFRIRKCRCGAAARDGSEVVLASKQGWFSKLPLPALGAVTYVELAWLVRSGHHRPAVLLAALAVAASAALAYVMVTRIRALCSTCINIAALNLLILLQLLR